MKITLFHLCSGNGERDYRDFNVGRYFAIILFGNHELPRKKVVDGLYKTSRPKAELLCKQIKRKTMHNEEE